MKRTITVIIALLLAFALFAGCTKESPPLKPEMLEGYVAPEEKTEPEQKEPEAKETAAPAEPEQKPEEKPEEEKTEEEPAAEPETEKTEEASAETETEPAEEKPSEPETTPETTPETAAEPEPAAEPTVEPVPVHSAATARELLSEMTLREKICQMIIVRPGELIGEYQVYNASDSLLSALGDLPVGGVIYDGANMSSIDQLRGLVDDMQGASSVPLLTMCDEEGGRVKRLMNIGTTYVGAMLNYKDEGTGKAFSNAETIAKDMVRCGMNLDLAPVADVWSNPANTVIGDRAYSDNAEQAAELVSAAVGGFHAGGVACTLKHFPGHGDTSADTHYGSAVVYKTLDELRANELIPFKAGIDAGADCVMLGHMIINEVSDEPGLFSREIVTDLLRGELGFSGVVMTDALEMQALTDSYGNDEVAVRAVKAGVDMLLCPTNAKSAVNALIAAVESGEISEAHIDESVLRILSLKENLGLLG